MIQYIYRRKQNYKQKVQKRTTSQIEMRSKNSKGKIKTKNILKSKQKNKAQNGLKIGKKVKAKNRSKIN